MGRPLNKKYFGNRNIGSASTRADDGIGGEGVASVVLNALGAYTTRPTITFLAPQLPGGVTATGTITSEILSATTSNGTTGTGYVVGDLVTFTGITGVVGYVATVGVGVGEIQSITFTQAGTSRSSFEALPGATSGVAVVGGSGTLGQVDILFRANAVVITEKGSGYTGVPTPTFSQSVTATSVLLTTDSGAVGSATNQENAIIIRANTSAGGTTAKVGDIIKQSNTRSYKVKTADGIKICKLGTTATPAPGGAYIVATAASGGTYYVTKLTAHRATLVAKTGDNALDGKSAKWSFAPADGNIVQIENA